MDVLLQLYYRYLMNLIFHNTYYIKDRNIKYKIYPNFLSSFNISQMVMIVLLVYVRLKNNNNNYNFFSDTHLIYRIE